MNRPGISARLHLDMGTMSSSPGSPEPHRGGNTDDGMIVLSYILAGLILYGGLGWLGSHYLNQVWPLPAGLIIGLASSIYLIIKRYGRTE